MCVELRNNLNHWFLLKLTDASCDIWDTTSAFLVDITFDTELSLISEYSTHGSSDCCRFSFARKIVCCIYATGKDPVQFGGMSLYIGVEPDLFVKCGLEV